ncbi:BLUF domain-containing protein [uncultured Zhongshania sp.]|uniref:BLUF domain-containing protein n=1 Tax=uncultured Zhongshania sp. TaxID=1642288 RepID=UPI0030DDA14E|tara:strand:+ start:2197 stop:3036 length:840 start_codon:yes stop_codon:yes gene_type:complete
MKRIACISTITTQPDEGDASTQLMALYNSTRVYNRENDITGVFLVSDSSCLQIMEGNAESLANAIYRIGRDPRISDFSVVMNCNADAAEFAGWKIRIIGAGTDAHLDFIARLKESLADKIQAKSSTDKTRLESFFGRPELPTPTPTTTLATPTPAPANISSTSKKIYEDCVVSVSAWPRPTQMRMTPELIRLCSNLTKRPAHFERILALKLCSSNEKLTHYLSVLESLGLLKTHSSVGVPNLRVVSNPSISANTAEQPVNKTADRFSRVLRRFIASAKS